MLVSLIAAMDRRGLIGDAAGLPWHLPRDLQRFKAYTLGKPVVMGRTTFQLIGRPLPGRLNIVLSRDPAFAAPGCVVAHSLSEGIALGAEHVTSSGGGEVVVAGGSQVYANAIRLWDRLYLTVVEGDFSGNAFFPVDELRALGGHLVHEEVWPPDERNRHPHRFYVIERDRAADQPPSQRMSAVQSLPTGQLLDVPSLFPRRMREEDHA
jgi:dihydrofolate reductase